VTTSVRILLLEDDSTDAELIRELLADHFDCKITQVQTRADFTNALQSGDFDLILSDYQLPSFDGISALKLVLSERPDLPFIFMSGAIGEETAVETLKVGATDYVLKSRPTKVVPAVQRALREAQERAERQKAQEELRASEARFRIFVDHATDAFFLLDDDSTVLDVNLQACGSLDYSREELIGKHRSDFDVGLGDALIHRLKQRVVAGEAITFETRHQRKDGSSFPVEVQVSQFEQGGRRFLCLARDITERKRAEDELRASEQRFRSFVDHATDGFFLFDERQALIDVNQQACESLGYSRDEMIGMHPHDFDVALDQASIARIGERVTRGDTVTFETLHRRKDGTVFPVEVRARQFQRGAHRFRLSLARDLSERKRAEDELRKSEVRFRTLVQFSFDVYWESDAQHRFTRQEFAEGLADAPAPGSEIGKTRWEVPYLEPDEEVWRKHRETLDAHLPFREFELARPAPDGGKRYVSVSGLPLFDETGRFIGYRGVGRHITERKRADEALRDGQTKLEAAQRIAHVGWWERDYITGQVALSDEVCRIFGVQPLELPQWHDRWLKLIHPEDRPRAAEAAAAARRGDARYDVEYRVIRPNGDVRIIHSQGDVTWDQSRRPLRQFGVLQDITELRQAENELRASETRFRTFVDHATDAFYLLDEDWTVLDVNRQACHDLGYSREELIGKHKSDFDVGLDDTSIRRLKQRMVAGEAITFETRHRRKDGTSFPVEVRVGQFEQAGRRFLCLVRDISQRKRVAAQHTIARVLAEAAKVEEAGPKILEALCECLAWDLGTMWRIDRDAGVLRCAHMWINPSVEAARFEAATRASTFQRGHGLPGQVWASRLAACIADVGQDPTFLRASTATQEGLHAAFAFPILLGDEVVGVIDFASRDIRQPDEDLLEMMSAIGHQIGQFIERKRAENALQALQAEVAHMNRVMTMGELTASITHEVSQPLTGLVSSANACLRYLADEVRDIAAARRATERIISDGFRASEVVSRIRALARKSPERRDWVNINDTVLETVSIIRTELRRNDISLRTELNDSLPVISGDQIQLQQLFINLMTNAIEAMSTVADHPRELVISTERLSCDELLVRVRDTGPGLQTAKADKIFEAFFTTKPNGMGMGLKICRSIVESHGGRLWATPNHPRGAVFQFTLPIEHESG
jgi:PAS domain S-box-containing protein